MSVDALSWAFRLSLPPYDKLVMLALADRADEFGSCFPAVADIVWRTGVCARLVRKTFTAMAAAGLIEVRRRFRSDGSQTSNEFVLQVGEPGAVGFTPKRVPGARSGPLGDSLTAQHQAPLPLSRESSPPLSRESSPPLSRESSPPLSGESPPPYPESHPMNRHSNHQKEPSARSTESEATRDESRARAGTITEASKSRDRSAVTPRIPFPSDWTASELDLAYAAKLGLMPDATAAAFRRYWLRRSVEEPGSATSTNWSRNWQTWCRNEIEFRERDAASAGRQETVHAPPVVAAPKPQVGHPILSTLDPGLAAEVQGCLDDPGSRTLWRWALAQQGIEVMWRDNHGRQTCAFSLGKGYLDVIIINLCYHGGIPKIAPADCNQVVAWMADYPVVGEFIDTATETIVEARGRWRGTPPYSLRAYDPVMQRAAVAWRDSRMGQACMRDVPAVSR